MRKILLILFFLFGIQIYSQENAFRELDAYLSDYKNFDFENFKNHEFETFGVDNNTMFENPLCLRERDNQIREKIYYLELNIPKYYKRENKPILLKTFSQNGDIFLIIYHKSDYFSEYFEPKYFRNEEKINSILKSHNNFYQSNLTVEKMIEQISDENVYGYTCGEAPIIQKIPSYKGYKFNKKSNIEEFRNWTKSFNPELQTYGVDALEYLVKNKNVRLTEQDNKIINHIKLRNSLLNSCSGCLFGIYEKAFD